MIHTHHCTQASVSCCKPQEVRACCAYKEIHMELWVYSKRSRLYIYHHFLINATGINMSTPKTLISTLFGPTTCVRFSLHFWCWRILLPLLLLKILLCLLLLALDMADEWPQRENHGFKRGPKKPIKSISNSVVFLHVCFLKGV